MQNNTCKNSKNHANLADSCIGGGDKNNYVPVFVRMNINACGWQTPFGQIKCLMKLTDQGAERACSI